MENSQATLIIPALRPFHETTSPYSYALMRFATGAVLVPHGIQKVFFGSIERYTQIIAAKVCSFPSSWPI